MSVGPKISSRIFTLLILAGLATLCWFAILLPANDWKTSAFSELKQTQFEKTRLDASLVRLEAEKEQLSGGSNLAVIWKAKRMGEATALVQSKISDLAVTSGVMLRSITPVSGQNIPFVAAIGFRIEGEATLDKLTAFLVELEANTPALITDRAVLRRLNRPGRTAAQPDVFIQLHLIAPIMLDQEEET